MKVTHSPGNIRFAPGKTDLISFLSQVSEKLDLQINASGIGGGSPASITVPATGPLLYDQALNLARTLVSLEGYTLLRDETTGTYRVLRARDARDAELPIVTDAQQLPENDSMVIYALPLKHVAPEYAARTLRTFAPANSRIIPNEGTNTVFITDAARNMTKYRRIVETFDTPETARAIQAEAKARASTAQTDPGCAPLFAGPPPAAPAPLVWIVLFSLIALVIGFLARGYVIRRIEGGL